jgi:ComF family protein
MLLKRLLVDFLHLIYPNNCFVCNESLVENESFICLSCLHKLPKTNYHLQQENPVEKLFWGKVEIENACSFLFFEKGSSVQKLLHQIKYKGEKELGEELGKHFGNTLLESNKYSNIDLIVPVPLHKKRYNKRGYNQSEWIAKGLAEKLKCPIEINGIVRRVENETQTKKGVYERWENTQDIFSVTDSETFVGKHILIVDDVLTTGATIESCAECFSEIEGTKISIATLAVAH